MKLGRFYAQRRICQPGLSARKRLVLAPVPALPPNTNRVTLCAPFQSITTRDNERRFDPYQSN